MSLTLSSTRFPRHSLTPTFIFPQPDTDDNTDTSSHLSRRPLNHSHIRPNSAMSVSWRGLARAGLVSRQGAIASIRVASSSASRQPRYTSSNQFNVSQWRFQSSTTISALSNKNLGAIDQAAKQGKMALEVPNFDRSEVKEGIVHVGVGGFHRAHLAMYIDRLMNQHGDRDWAICGVGLRPFDAGIRDALVDQDCLYTLVERGEKSSSARVIGSISSFLFAPDGPSKVIDKMAHPDTRIVSMTITESGYYYNENTHQLQIQHPDIAADLAGDLSSPQTIFGFLFAALAKRRAAGLKPFTVLSCDNMQKNGSITRHMLLTFARARDPQLADWIEAEGRFPNSMVDRITPRTTDEDKVSLSDNFGVKDSWPVVCEPFTQWVIEDTFANGRPALEKVGVQVVPNVHEVEKFECHKLRLLNASHTAIAYAAYLSGIEYVHEVFKNPVFYKFVYDMMHKEVKPLMPAIEGVDIDKYCDTLLQRFANPNIKDQVSRLTINGSGKLPQFIMPSVAEQIMAGTHDFKRLVFVTASWFRFLNGTDEQGKPIFIDDAMVEDLRPKAIEGGDKPFPLLDVKSLFGDDLRNDKIFVEELTKAMESLYREGTMATLAKYAA